MFEPNSTIGSAIGQLRVTAQDLLRFLRAPTLAAQSRDETRALSGVAWLFLLNCLIVLAIALVIFPAMLLLGVEMSNSMSELFDRPAWQILAIVVVVGPVLEEVMFRSWIHGRPLFLVLFGGLLAWIGGSYALQQAELAMTNTWAPAALLAVIGLITVVAMVRVRKQATPGWYARIFPLIFWGQALLFGFVHVFNYAGDNVAALLPFVLPQLVGGLIWGYARIRYGWWSNIIMHMAYNLIAASGLLYVLLSGGAVG